MSRTSSRDQPTARVSNTHPRAPQRSCRRRLEIEQSAPPAALGNINHGMVTIHGAVHSALPVPPASAQQLACLAENSKRRYTTTWNEWCRFATSNNFHPILDARCNIHSARLFQFAKHLWHPAISNSASTIRGKLSIISWFHQCHSNYAVGLSRSHSIEFAGLARTRQDNLAKAPVTLAILRAIRSSLDLSITHDRVLWGSTVLAYFFLLRRSEYLAIDGAYSRHCIRQHDITFLDQNERITTKICDAAAVQLHIPSSKTDQAAAGTHLVLARSGLSWLCPVMAGWLLHRLGLARGAAPTEPLCSITADQKLTCEALAKEIKLAAASIGEDPSKYSSHSLRSGGATALFRGGASDLSIQLFGRW